MTPEFHHPQFIKQAYLEAQQLRYRLHPGVDRARILMQAVCEETNLKRFFHILTYPTLATGIWAIKVINGRMGCKGATRHYHFDNTQELQTKLRLLLLKRLNATRRIGVNYHITHSSLSHHILTALVAKKTHTAQKETRARHTAKQKSRQQKQADVSGDAAPQVSPQSTPQMSLIHDKTMLSPSLTGQPFSSQSSGSASAPTSKTSSSTLKATRMAQDNSSHFTPTNSNAYLWQSCGPTQHTPETRLRREEDSKVREQKLQDTITALNKRMGKDTVVVAASPLKSQWAVKS